MIISYHKRFWLLAALLAALPTAGGAARAQTAPYAIADLGTVTGGASYQPQALNAAGAAAGYVSLTGSDPSTEINHAALFSGGAVTDLGTLGGDDSEAYAINKYGQVAGEAAVFGDFMHAFVYANGTMTDLGVLSGDTDSEARGINAQGQVAGVSYSSQSFKRGFVYSGGVMTAINPFPQGTSIDVAGINDSGQVAGTADGAGYYAHAFLMTQGALQDLGIFSGGTYSEATAINASGQVAGYADTASGDDHAFLCTGRTMTDLGTLPGGTFSAAFAVNAAGQAVGISDSGTSMDAVPVLFSGGRSVSINSLLPAGSGWTLLDVDSINDSGQIVGTGINPQGLPRAFLLTPPAGAPSAPVRFDFDGDGHSDLLWHNSSSGQSLVWNMNDQNTLIYGSPFATVASADWTIAAAADVNNDGIPDLLWHNTRTGQVLFWLMGGTNGTTVTSYGSPFATVSDTHWNPVSLADFNGDGHPDILWENSKTGQLVVWQMNGMSVLSYGSAFASVSDTHWQVAGVADFDGDGHVDLLWENSQSGQLLVWNLGGSAGTSVVKYGSAFATVSNTSWRIVGTGDTNGDGHPDLVWENVQTGQVLRWLLGGINGTTVTSYGSPFATVADTHWQIVGMH